MVIEDLTPTFMYSKMFEDMLYMAKLQHGAKLQCKYKSFKIFFKCFPSKNMPYKGRRNVAQRTNGFDNECHEAQKCGFKKKEYYKKHLHEYKRLIQRKRRI